MKEVGLDITQYEIFSVEGNGACGSTCTAVHCHRDKKLSQYVRRNVNEYLVEFWPFFKAYFTFPLNVKVGMEEKLFEDEKIFLKFLKSDENSGLIWMDHIGLQVVSNMYQISVHILTTGVIGTEEPQARWTHLVPDTRLSDFSTIVKGLPDMYLIHSDEIHFDLLIRKDSELALEGSVDEIRSTEEGKDCLFCEMCDKTFKNEKDLKEHVQIHEMSNVELGPGYMGWKISEVEEKDQNNIQDEIKELKNAVNVMKEELDNIRNEVGKKEKKQITLIKN